MKRKKYRTKVIYQREHCGIWFTVTEMDGGYIAAVRGESIGIGPFYRDYFESREKAVAEIERQWDEMMAV